MGIFVCFYTEIVESPSDGQATESSYWVGLKGLYARSLAWLMQRMPNERQRLLAVTILAGGCADWRL